MMMSLDTFLFEIGTLPYQQLAEEWSWRHASTERFAARPAVQFIGPGAETKTLSGALYAGVVGDHGSIERLREMADAGEAYTLLSGRYEVLGQYIIRKLSLAGEIFTVDGVARRSDFTLELERVE